MTGVLDARVIEVGEIASVVDDALGVGIGEADAREGGELEGGSATARMPETERYRVIVAASGARSRFGAVTSSG